ncbi:hypothetical protein RUND412_007353 [Rhizina undulata]
MDAHTSRPEGVNGYSNLLGQQQNQQENPNIQAAQSNNMEGNNQQIEAFSLDGMENITYEELFGGFFDGRYEANVQTRAPTFEEQLQSLNELFGLPDTEQEVAHENGGGQDSEMPDSHGAGQKATTVGNEGVASDMEVDGNEHSGANNLAKASSGPTLFSPQLPASPKHITPSTPPPNGTQKRKAATPETNSAKKQAQVMSISAFTIPENLPGNEPFDLLAKELEIACSEMPTQLQRVELDIFRGLLLKLKPGYLGVSILVDGLEEQLPDTPLNSAEILNYNPGHPIAPACQNIREIIGIGRKLQGRVDVLLEDYRTSNLAQSPESHGAKAIVEQLRALEKQIAKCHKILGMISEWVAKWEFGILIGMKDLINILGGWNTQFADIV